MSDYIKKIRVKENGVMVEKQIDYNALANLPTVEQTTGDSETALMSQKAITEALANAGGGSQFYISSQIANVETFTFDYANLTIVTGQREPQVGDFICASLRGSNLYAFYISSITDTTYTATYAFPIQGDDGTNGTDGKGIVGTLEQTGITTEYNIGDTVVVESPAYYTSAAGNYFILRYGNTSTTDYRSLLLKLHVYSYNGTIHTYTCSAVCYLTGEKGVSSNVSFTPALTSGTQIGTLTIDGASQTLYAPQSSGSGGSSASLYEHSISISHSVEKDGITYSFRHIVKCLSTDNTQATDAYSAYAYIGSQASALSYGYYGTGNQVWCINGSVGWNGGFFNVKFGAIINGAFVDFSTYMTEATYSDTVRQIM